MNKKLLFLAAVVLSGCENGNIFSWTHSAGGSNSAEALMSDADKAAYDGSYEDAIKYYDEILRKDPGNSRALYGKASAELKNSGLDLSEIIPSFLEQDESAGKDLLGSLNLKKLEAGTGEAIDALKAIADGRGDGTIPSDDFDVNLNLGIAIAVNEMADLLNWAEASGAVEIKDDFSMEVIDDAPDELKDKLMEAKDAIEEAINYLKVAASSSGNDINEVESKFEVLLDSLDAEIDKL